MKRQTAMWVRKAEEDFEGARPRRPNPTPPRPGVLPLSAGGGEVPQGLLQELGVAVPKTHDLEDLLDLLLPHDATLAPLRRVLIGLGRYAVDDRYPGSR